MSNPNSLVLTTTWNPRGELPRLVRLLPLLRQAYSSLVVILPPGVDPALAASLSSLGIITDTASDWACGRFLALQRASQLSGDFIQYADLDRLLRWVETRPQEWRMACERIMETDCVCFGRTSAAYATHPQALIKTEAASNRLISHFLGRDMDVSAGSKGFSRAALNFLVANTQPGSAMGMDAAWLVLLNRAGYQVSYCEVDGLDWESADQYLPQAADPEQQRKAAQEYDQHPNHWEWRVKVADEVISSGIFAASQPIDPHWLNPNAHFEVQDYLHFYGQNLTAERSEQEVEHITRLLKLDQALDILDLACGFGRHSNRLAALGHKVVGIDIEAGFLAKARLQAQQMGLQVDYRLEDMRNLLYHAAFDLALLLFTSFGYFDDDGNLKVLRSLQQALRPGGRLLMDIPNRNGFMARLVPITLEEAGQDLMINRSSSGSDAERWYNRRIVIRNGVRKDKPFFLRLYDVTEITNLLLQVGFKAVDAYSSFAGNSFTADSPRLVLIASR